MNPAKVPNVPALSWPVTIAVALNLIPIVGVLFWGWSAFALLFLYWLENVVIGVRTVLSMLASAVVAGGMNWLGALFFCAFFTFHYGLFCFGHGIFLIVLFGQGTGIFAESQLDLFAATLLLFEQQDNLLIGFASIVAWQVIMFVIFLTRGEVRRTNVLDLMGAPYPRIIALHVALIFGGALLMALGQPVWGLVVLALVKMAADIADVSKKPKPVVAQVVGDEA